MTQTGDWTSGGDRAGDLEGDLDAEVPAPHLRLELGGLPAPAETEFELVALDLLFRLGQPSPRVIWSRISLEPCTSMVIRAALPTGKVPGCA